MIEGTDIVLKSSKSKKELFNICIEIISKYWERFVVENAITSQIYDFKRIKITNEETELFIYKNHKFYYIWNKTGKTDITKNSMIYILCYGEGTLTLVVDDENEIITSKIISEIKEKLN